MCLVHVAVFVKYVQTNFYTNEAMQSLQCTRYTNKAIQYLYIYKYLYIQTKQYNKHNVVDTRYTNKAMHSIQYTWYYINKYI